MDINLEDLCNKTCDVAIKAGMFIAEERIRFDSSKIEYKGVHDLVSYVDKCAEQLIVDDLRQLLPMAGFIAEEGTVLTKGEDYQWIIDPLDGTTNFVQGIPVFSVSIGLAYKTELLLGVVYEIGQKECFYAWKGGGAYLNSTPIQVSGNSDMHQCLLATGFPYSEFGLIDSYFDFLKWAMRNSRGVRRIGSAAVDLVYVACGRFDAFWEYDLKPWDVAAGAIIVKEAGGKVTDFKGEDDYLFGRTIVATNRGVNYVLMDKLNEFMG
jgi:myo-inositol-1(or 4)-monophosphatase